MERADLQKAPGIPPGASTTKISIISISIMKLSVANIAIFALFLGFTFLFREYESNIELLVKSQ